ncbi:hypothetical protein Tco_1354385 [Tanacetum coccineum]
MIALDRQRVRAQRRHSLHHYWLIEGDLSGINLGGRSLGKWQKWPLKVYKCVANLVLDDTTLVLGVWVGIAPLVLLGTNGGVIKGNGSVIKGSVGLVVWAGYGLKGLGLFI